MKDGEDGLFEIGDSTFSGGGGSRRCRVVDMMDIKALRYCA